MTQVYFIKDTESNDFERVLEEQLKPRFKPGMRVAAKLHMGTDKGMFSPELAKRAISVLNKLGCKPFLFDTPVFYPGNRDTKERYLDKATKHGFTEDKIGCPVMISTKYVPAKTEHMNLEVSKDFAEADALLVLTHVKGHPASAMGGSVKNIAMGCVSPKSCGDQHSIGVPVVNDKCTACSICAEACPFKAIEIKDKAVINKDSCAGCSTCFHICPSEAITCTANFDQLLAESAFACMKLFGDKPVFYVNDVRSITKMCDCFANPGEIIAKDVGVLLSDDIAAIDIASVDLVNKQEGKDIFQETHNHDPLLHVRNFVKRGLGSEDYELV